MSHELKFPPEKFGTLLGHAPGNVPIYSSHYPSVDPREYPTPRSYRSYLDGIYMGYKWQCVEFARRWLYLNKGYIFQDVAMAYDIFRLRYVRRVADNAVLPLHSFFNGSVRLPEPGCLLIWKEGGEFEVTGHVAIVTEVLEDRIRFAEQNVEHRKVPHDQPWSRELPVARAPNGGYAIDAAYPDTEILGWVIQTHDDRGAVEHEDIEPYLYNLNSRKLTNAGQAKRPWLDESRADERAYVAAQGGHHLTQDEAEQYRYFRMSDAAEDEVIRATNELHLMFLHATERVLNDERLLAYFNIPQSLWPRLRRSWEKRRGEMITGRFDFCVSDRGIKLYEYNADSASCYLEAARIQGKWARHFGCKEGEDPGAYLYDRLIAAWRESGVDSLLHIMQDNDKEETYHAQFMKSAIEAAGIPCKVLKGVQGLSWSADGAVLDPDDDEIRWVWKTWAWETALEQIRAECEDDDAQPPLRTGDQPHQPPRLVDVLLRPDVMVFEPFWTLIPSNKAILPIMWQLFPNHPYLLDAQFELTDELQQRGYVTKPIAGRCGDNVALFDRHENLLKETRGRFAHQDQIVQELWRLPDIDTYRTQVCAFSVAGNYGGSCVRVDRSLIITTHSDVLPLRIVQNDTL